MIASCFIIWRSAAGFEIASDYLGRKLSHGVKGATLNAIASSMPEFLSSFFFLFYLKDVNGFSGGLGITAGSSIFNLLVDEATLIAHDFVGQFDSAIYGAGMHDRDAFSGNTLKALTGDPIMVVVFAKGWKKVSLLPLEL